MTITLDGTTGVTAPALTGSIDASNLTGVLPAIDGSALTSLAAGNLTGVLPAIDGSALTGIAPTTADVLTATAGATVGAVGTYVLAKYASDTTAAAGSTHAGSNLQPVSLSHISTYTATPNGSALSGTWRAMGYLADWLPVTLFVRIS